MNLKSQTISIKLCDVVTYPRYSSFVKQVLHDKTIESHRTASGGILI